ncbi:hypothetical protein ACFWUZ_33725 [Streptomyces sp. NPDC058646]|uniref:hypothetical protein n=1 Tax=Streptomyces sp. NPDC058646 TaxID=3346574 RepID=UPI00364B255C
MERPTYDEKGNVTGIETLVVNSFNEAEDLIREIDPLTHKPLGGGVRHQNPE